VVDGKLNLWRGWAVQPAPGDWSLMRRHIYEVLASGNPAHGDYMLRFCAWSVQNPGKPAEVALVLKGMKGTGKGTLGNTMVRIAGQHGVHISSAEHLAGRFNAHLRDAVFLFADEAYWPGDKSAEGNLKRLVTEPDLFIEAKFKDGLRADNCLHIIMATNDDWVVPASEGERRYAVFEVSDQQMQKANWFEPLYRQMENGGYEAMLHDLLHMDLGDWHPRKNIPQTDALRDQQLRSLKPVDRWLVSLLEDGELPGRDPRLFAQSWAKPDYSGYNPRDGLFDLAYANVPSLQRIDPQVLAAELKKMGAIGVRVGAKRRVGWKFPQLSDCRAWWESRYPDWKWREPELDEWIVDAGEAEERERIEMQQERIRRIA
jgi:hypothetical protein